MPPKREPTSTEVGRPTRTRLTAAERSNQLLDVAEVLFLERGFDGTTIEDIARAAGVSRPIVYEHHGSKEGVYLAALARARAGLADAYAEAIGTATTPAEVLRAGAEVWFSLVERDRDRWLLLFGSSLPLPPTRAAEADRERKRNADLYVDAVRAWSRPEVADEQVSAVALMIAGTGGQLAHWWLANPHVDRTQVVDYFTDFCLHGLGPLLPGSGSRG